MKATASMAPTKTKEAAALLRRGRARSARSSAAVVGLGYVGLPLALAAEESGYRVIGFDIDTKKVERLLARRADHLAPSEQRTFGRTRMVIGSDEAPLGEADIIVICVPTPVTADHAPDLEPLRRACVIVGRNLKRDALVIVESTVNPGVCETLALPILESVSGLSAGSGFFFAHCPERVNPGDPEYTVRNIPRVVGASEGESLARAVSFYRSIIDADVVLMGSLKEAEAVKMVENAFRDVNIAFVNELAQSFGKAGIDIVNVLSGAATKPFAFMRHNPGCGVGGHCIPVDPYYLIQQGRENGFAHRLLIAAREINNGMPAYTVKLLASGLRERGCKLRGARIALLGLSYKRGIPDTRESPALAIKGELILRGASVQSFDPYVMEQSSAANLDQALDGADAVVIATDHDAFAALDPKELLKRGVRIVVDGRNCLAKEAFLSQGITYLGVGR